MLQSSEKQQVWTQRGVEMTWDPSASVVRMRFVREIPRGSGAQARDFVTQIQAWSRGRERIGILVDCDRIHDADANWRMAVNEHFRDPPVRAAVAWYNATPFIRVMLEMFLVGARGVDGGIFQTEAEARAFLGRRGFG